MIVLLALLMAKDLGPVSGRSPGVSSEENSVAIASHDRLQRRPSGRKKRPCRSRARRRTKRPRRRR